MSYDILGAVRSGAVEASWSNLQSEHKGHHLIIGVMRDAMKFNEVPAMTWDRKVLDPNKKLDGVRLGVTAKEMQQIADLMYCMLPTPKVLDLVWEAAGKTGTQLESVVNVKGTIVAMSNIHDCHEAVEAAIAKAGGDRGGFIESVAKYWVLSNRLINGKFGVNQAVNYAWFTRQKGNGPGVTGTVNVWQTVGAAHDSSHQDPSQGVRLMYRTAKLLRAGATDWVEVDLWDIAGDPELAPLISHEGVLKTTRMLNVPLPEPVLVDGVLTMPETIIFGDPFADLVV